MSSSNPRPQWHELDIIISWRGSNANTIHFMWPSLIFTSFPQTLRKWRNFPLVWWHPRMGGGEGSHYSLLILHTRLNIALMMQEFCKWIRNSIRAVSYCDSVINIIHGRPLRGSSKKKCLPNFFNGKWFPWVSWVGGSVSQVQTKAKLKDMAIDFKCMKNTLTYSSSNWKIVVFKVSKTKLNPELTSYVFNTLYTYYWILFVTCPL